VLVVVTQVGGVPVPVMDVVDMVAMLYSVVTAAGFVSVVMVVVGYVRKRVLVVMAFVRRVRVTMMYVVGVSLVLDARVPAARAVLMRVLRVDFVDIGSHHVPP
jgi:hypothetical protein